MIDRIEEYETLPQCCQECPDRKDEAEYGVDAICYNCDHYLDRFYLLDENGNKIEI